MSVNKLSIHCTGCAFNVNGNCLRYDGTRIPCRFEEVLKSARDRDIYEQLCKECDKLRSNNNA